MADPITWLTQDMTVDASWSGGVPIDGFTSYSGHSDSIINPAVGGIASHVLPLTGRMTAGLASFQYGFPAYASFGVDLGMTYEYNELFSDGTRDFSMRTFSIATTHSYVFEITESMDFYVLTLHEVLAPWSICEIESGSWSAGAFAPSGVAVDMKTTTTARLAPGFYRFRADAANTFSRDSYFLDGTYANWRLYPIPEPSSIAMLALCGLVALRRRG